jgi:VIT1/CCC1 family predicted Fe2+/Mn2+ transporter
MPHRGRATPEEGRPMKTPGVQHPPTARDLARYRANRQAEVDSAVLYRALADREQDPRLKGVFRRMADAELAHADFWERSLEGAGERIFRRRPSWRAHMLVWLARRLGARAVLPVVLDREESDRRRYAEQAESRKTPLPGQERSHRRLLRAIAGAYPEGVEGGMIARFEGRHRSVGGNALRAAVLGVNDGLVSNLSLVMGVAGAAVSDRGLLVTGLAGLLAGAGSMAMGEWLSVQSSRELSQRQIEIEATELEEMPEEEEHELALIYQAKGLPEDQARALAAKLIATPTVARDTLAREELGIEPSELGGSAWEAAATSFALFAVGAIVPVLPFFFTSDRVAIVASLIVSAVALFLVGAGITLLTGRSVWSSGMRQLLFGLGAAGLTYAVGRLVGVHLGG